MNELYALEQLALGDTFIHKLHPMVKLLTAMAFIIAVVSFDRYSPGRLIPYIFYPSLLMPLSQTPYSMLLKRALVALPFCLFAGITNIFFEKTVAIMIGNIAISYGMISFFVLMLRTYLCVMAVLLLVSVTPLSDITASMRELHVPAIFVTMLEMTYRYIGVLLDETRSMYIAYSLRSGSIRGIAMKDMGSFAGQLLLRSLERAERVYNAMKCRGYALKHDNHSPVKFSRTDIAYLFTICLLCVIGRIFDINALFGKLFWRI